MWCGRGRVMDVDMAEILEGNEKNIIIITEKK
jgi:hypothetical protein